MDLEARLDRFVQKSWGMETPRLDPAGMCVAWTDGPFSSIYKPPDRLVFVDGRVAFVECKEVKAADLRFGFSRLWNSVRDDGGTRWFPKVDQWWKLTNIYACFSRFNRAEGFNRFGAFVMIGFWRRSEGVDDTFLIPWGLFVRRLVDVAWVNVSMTLEQMRGAFGDCLFGWTPESFHSIFALS